MINANDNLAGSHKKYNLKELKERRSQYKQLMKCGEISCAECVKIEEYGYCKVIEDTDGPDTW